MRNIGECQPGRWSGRLRSTRGLQCCQQSDSCPAPGTLTLREEGREEGLRELDSVNNSQKEDTFRKVPGQQSPQM